MVGKKVSVRTVEPTVAVTTVPPGDNSTLELDGGGAPGKSDGGATLGTPELGLKGDQATPDGPTVIVIGLLDAPRIVVVMVAVTVAN